MKLHMFFSKIPKKACDISLSGILPIQHFSDPIQPNKQGFSVFSSIGTLIFECIKVNQSSESLES